MFLKDLMMEIAFYNDLTYELANMTGSMVKMISTKAVDIIVGNLWVNR